MTDPASWLVKVGALRSKTSRFGHVFLSCGSTLATLSLKALLPASLIDMHAFHINIVDETPETFDHHVRILCTKVLATIFCRGFGVITKGWLSASWSASGRLWTEPRRVAPIHASATRSCCLSSSHMCVHTCRNSVSLPSRNTLLLTPVHKYHAQSLSGKL